LIHLCQKIAGSLLNRIRKIGNTDSKAAAQWLGSGEIQVIILLQQYFQSFKKVLVFVALLNITAGFIFNNIFAYCISRFTKNGGIVSGLTGGSLFVITSFFSYGIVNALSIKSQVLLGSAYLLLILFNAAAFIFFQKYRYALEQRNVLSQAA